MLFLGLTLPKWRKTRARAFRHRPACLVLSPFEFICRSQRERPEFPRSFEFRVAPRDFTNHELDGVRLIHSLEKNRDGPPQIVQFCSLDKKWDRGLRRVPLKRPSDTIRGNLNAGRNRMLVR